MSPALPPTGVEARLRAVEEKLGRIEAMLGRLDAADSGARALFAMGTDAVDRAAARDPAAAETRLRSLIGVLDRLSRPETVAQLEVALDVAEKLPAGLAIATDSIDRMAQSLGERGVDLGDRFVTLFRLLERLTSPEILSVLEQGLQHHEAASRILSSGAFAPPALDIIGKLAGALAGAAHDPPRIGLWGAMRAAGTAPVQHALGFAVSLAARFGAAIAEDATRPALTRGAE
jgi:uncharacterized protein YjgD (DUF1641 family)